MVMKMVISNLKSKLKWFKSRKKPNNYYDKVDKTESMRVEIKSNKAKKLIADTLKIADSPGRKSFIY